MRWNLGQIPGLCTSLWLLRLLSYKILSDKCYQTQVYSFSTHFSLLQTKAHKGGSAQFYNFPFFVLFFLPSSPPHPRSYCTSCPSSLRKTTSISCSNISAAQRVWTKKDCRRPPLSGSARGASGRLQGYWAQFYIIMTFHVSIHVYRLNTISLGLDKCGVVARK